MKLLIDTSDREKILVGLKGKRFTSKAKEGASQRLLPFIDEVLKQEGVSLKEISEIEVETGAGLPAGRQGSFTGPRVGVSVANALGWALGIPVNGKNLRKGDVVDIHYE